MEGYWHDMDMTWTWQGARGQSRCFRWGMMSLLIQPSIFVQRACWSEVSGRRACDSFTSSSTVKVCVAPWHHCVEMQKRMFVPWWNLLMSCCSLSLRSTQNGKWSTWRESLWKKWLTTTFCHICLERSVSVTLCVHTSKLMWKWSIGGACSAAESLIKQGFFWLRYYFPACQFVSVI